MTKKEELGEKTKTGLTYGEIWRAYPQLRRLGDVKLPIRASIKIAEHTDNLERPYNIIEKERLKILKEYVEVDKKTKQKKSLTPSDETYPAFMEKWEELLDMEWGKEIKIEKVKLPEKIAGTCDACHHNLDVEFLIEPSILVPLREKFVEVV